MWLRVYFHTNVCSREREREISLFLFLFLLICCLSGGPRLFPLSAMWPGCDTAHPPLKQITDHPKNTPLSTNSTLCPFILLTSSGSQYPPGGSSARLKHLWALTNVTEVLYFYILLLFFLYYSSCYCSIGLNSRSVTQTVTSQVFLSFSTIIPHPPAPPPCSYFSHPHSGHTGQMGCRRRRRGQNLPGSRNYTSSNLP